MIQVHENNLMIVVMNRHISFGMVHDIIDSIDGSGFYLLSAEIDF